DGRLPPRGGLRLAFIGGRYHLCRSVGSDSRSEQGAGSEDGATGLRRSGLHVLAGSIFPCALIQSCSSSPPDPTESSRRSWESQCRSRHDIARHAATPLCLGEKL